MGRICMRKILENLELVLTAAGLLVIFTAHILFHSSADPGSWKVSALTATAVGVLHGVIFWLVRRRQRGIRRETLRDVERMLKDIINNQLCIIAFTSEMQKADPSSVLDANNRITQSVRRIHTSLEGISEESLNLWKSQYGNLLPRE
jgi:4-amino-4-deoxy-L-arabinose transferase-like glycosyltransferase